MTALTMELTMELHIPTITTPCPENFAEKHDESILRDIEKVITTASLMAVVTATGINPLSINGMEQLTKYFEVVAELHKMGYEQIRMTDDPEIVKQALNHFDTVLSEDICKGCKIRDCNYTHLQ